MMAEDIIKKPFVTEKSNMEVASGKYTFIVDTRATKTQIKMAVEKLFNVKVIQVNTINYSGKSKRMGVHEGYRADWKKAIVKIDMDPNGDKTKNIKEKDSSGVIKTVKKQYTPGVYFDKGGKQIKSNKKYKSSIEEFGVVQ
jgi:large subunit ribosomal protein L23